MKGERKRAKRRKMRERNGKGGEREEFLLSVLKLKFDCNLVKQLAHRPYSGFICH